VAKYPSNTLNTKNFGGKNFARKNLGGKNFGQLFPISAEKNSTGKSFSGINYG
jgi:hypothetical protein